MCLHYNVNHQGGKKTKTSNTCKDLKSSCIISNSFKNPEYAT